MIQFLFLVENHVETTYIPVTLHLLFLQIPCLLISIEDPLLLSPQHLLLRMLIPLDLEI